jgi:hypothetical protein|uniref:Uncharacterized protein n=1 Tax=viral metagenome TaxID=1070528 RepID=A0A6C0D249_9ZZZZ
MKAIYIFFCVLFIILMSIYIFHARKELYLADYDKLQYCARRPSKKCTAWYY